MSRSTSFRRFAVRGLAVVAVATLVLVAARARTTTPAPADGIARGQYLVTIGGCNDCHTPWKLGPDGPEPDMSRALSGHPAELPLRTKTLAADDGWAVAMAATNTAFSGPWGVSFAANLTPCEDTGIGIWSEEIFINTLRRGRHWGQSRPLLPPMPWFNYGKMTDEDLKSVYAYLRTLPPVHNPVPLPLPPGEQPEKTEWWE